MPGSDTAQALVSQDPDGAGDADEHVLQQSEVLKADEQRCVLLETRGPLLLERTVNTARLRLQHLQL